MHVRLRPGACSAEDVFVPYMLDPRHPPDTVFFYNEHDFRFHEQDNISAREWLPLAAAAPPQGTSAISDVEPEPFARQEPPARRPRQQAAFSDMRQPTRMQGSEPVDVSPELLDCIHLVNEASRANLDDLVWLSWNACEAGRVPRRATHMAFGAQLIAFTVSGARRLQKVFASQKPWHIDAVLRWWCESDDPAARNCCYVFPPVGGFSSQHSSVNAEGQRTGPWDEAWSQGGTNPYNATFGKRWPQERQLALFAKKGPLNAVRQVRLPATDSSLFWRTQMPPRFLRSDDPLWWAGLRRRGWVTERGAWLGWAWQTVPRWWVDPPWKGRPKGKGKGKPSVSEVLRALPADNYWRRLQEAPEEPPSIGAASGEIPISALAYELATAPSGAEPSVLGASESREGRNLRAQRLMYCKRFFVREQAVPESINPVSLFISCPWFDLFPEKKTTDTRTRTHDGTLPSMRHHEPCPRGGA